MIQFFDFLITEIANVREFAQLARTIAAQLAKLHDTLMEILIVVHGTVPWKPR